MDQPKHIDNLPKANLTNIENKEGKEVIWNLCNEFRDIFWCENIPLSFSNEINFTMNSTDGTPIFSETYRFPKIHKEEIKSN